MNAAKTSQSASLGRKRSAGVPLNGLWGFPQLLVGKQAGERCTHVGLQRLMRRKKTMLEVGKAPEGLSPATFQGREADQSDPERRMSGTREPPPHSALGSHGLPPGHSASTLPS